MTASKATTSRRARKAAKTKTPAAKLRRKTPIWNSRRAKKASKPPAQMGADDNDEMSGQPGQR